MLVFSRQLVLIVDGQGLAGFFQQIGRHQCSSNLFVGLSGITDDLVCCEVGLIESGRRVAFVDSGRRNRDEADTNLVEQKNEN